MTLSIKDAKEIADEMKKIGKKKASAKIRKLTEKDLMNGYGKYNAKLHRNLLAQSCN